MPPPQRPEPAMKNSLSSATAAANPCRQVWRCTGAGCRPMLTRMAGQGVRIPCSLEPSPCSTQPDRAKRRPSRRPLLVHFALALLFALAVFVFLPLGLFAAAAAFAGPTAKSASFFPCFKASLIQTGWTPRPAQVSPFEFLYLIATGLPFIGLVLWLPLLTLCDT